MSKKAPIALAMIVVIGSLLAITLVRRSGNRVEINQVVHGWVLEYSGTHAASPDRPGTVKKLEYNNASVAVPKVASGQLPNVKMFSPVGVFVPDDEGAHWLMIQPSVRVYRTEGEISEEELSRGYYDVQIGDDLKQLPRKKNTPNHWCIITNKMQARWMSPDKIEEVTW